MLNKLKKNSIKIDHEYIEILSYDYERKRQNINDEKTEYILTKL